MEKDRVLLVRYEDTSSMGLGTWYALPGGRQRFGESLEEALVRECREELGADIHVGRLLFVREYIHSRHELKGTGRDQHKVEFMFRCSLESRPTEVRSADEDQRTFEWLDLSAMPGLNVFPTRLRELNELLDKPNGSVYWGDTY